MVSQSALKTLVSYCLEEPKKGLIIMERTAPDVFSEVMTVVWMIGLREAMLRRLKGLICISAM